MLDPAKVLAAADFEILFAHRFAAPASADPAIVALTNAVCAAANAHVRDIVQAALEILEHAQNREAANVKLAALRELAGIDSASSEV